MHFNRLRLTGFKSFVEPTELVIEPGLTGVIGPNGCGKSNLVEALRWVMGETSAKSMRGGAMDDVIFAGTATRPARGVAEVALHLDNSERLAPAAFNDQSELEISRRIRRDIGSNYRINGREVRARDVQLLFADLASGAHAAALVSQGRVGAIINAKPTDRRHLLEEAAGISGLHSRRHEAELRLRGAETNLERLDDVTGQLEAQLGALKRQARQASRYRNLSGHIRKAEAIVLHLRYRAAAEALEAVRRKLEECERAVGEASRQSASLARQEAEAAEALPALRQREAETAAALHRLAVARDALDQEEARIEAAMRDLDRRLEQVEADRVREDKLATEGVEALARLETEAADIAGRRAGEEAEQEAAGSLATAAARTQAERQGELDKLTERFAAERAERRSLDDKIADAGRRLARFRERLASIDGEIGKLDAASDAAAGADVGENDLEEARAEVEIVRMRLGHAEQERTGGEAAERAAHEASRAAQAALDKLTAEESGLARLLAIDEQEMWPPLIDALTVAAGYETALGAALGEDLDVATDIAAPTHWAALDAYKDAPALPPGTEPLAAHVKAPALFARRLGQTGLVAGRADGDRLQSALRPGQRLITRDGDLWRWDGLKRGAGAKTAAAIRLEQRNRLAEIRTARKAAEAALAKRQAAHRDTADETKEARERQDGLRRELNSAEARLNELRELIADYAREAAARASRIETLAGQRREIQGEIAELDALHADLAARRAALPPAEEGERALETARQALAEARTALAEAERTRDRLAREAADRAARLDAIAREQDSWRRRQNDASAQIERLNARRDAARAERDGLAQKPEEIVTKRSLLMEQIVLAEGARSNAADALAAQEAKVAEIARLTKEVQAALADVREGRVRLQADVEHGGEQLQAIAERMQETLETTPEEVLDAGGVEADEALPELGEVESRLERLKREREGMGPVNLRADIEAGEVQEQLDLLTTEREDLEAAIARLRQGISSLNKEGRQRLLAAFEQVDAHFQTLFHHVFGGGQAHLKLTESDDPLQAGLEIMASPPGKRLQIMSLLSGGEQALTALSLLFAVFLTNPAPICVLDEVDAPLDDSNVERLCDLLDRLVGVGNTRFLVVTHHPITMARMDRLYGVTMAERGVSQLVSVDLAAAEAMREIA
ncbi:chromosome segregation protein SMC [Oceanibacterium hippocampi]|uniref:Chromosome partition protein Smc n=1 Tax=Oceanibacterium hippocampi TaxID=745714 RepID=A0A1Y5S711_9PROT|nr:chromosome segregation protein SMC [Oceanibacterium hippocampi]SLN33920.1 Chromosome partition protein Smc [Oceanibacterium hippocampi]